MEYKYLFGPVQSRRLGKSLGIDLIPYKTCPLDCIYCECGKTNRLTVERREYVPVELVIEELNNYLEKKPVLDYITFAGSGEPTLHKKIAEIINFLKESYPEYKVALITNAILFADIRLIEEIKKVDLLVPSLDAVSEDIFHKINRPLADIKIENHLKGLSNIRKVFQGEIWLEIFIVPGINDNEEELKLFKKVVNEIDPDRVQLNTIDRPGTENWVQGTAINNLQKIAAKIKTTTELKVDILAKR